MGAIGTCLFSLTQQKVLGLLYGNPDKSFYFKEILRLTEMGVATIKAELDREVEAGLLIKKKVGNQHHYQANPRCAVYRELSALVRRICADPLQPSTSHPVAYESRRAPSPTAYVHEAPPSGTAANTPDAMLQQLALRYGIQRLSVFGSAARGELKADSDIDLLIEFRPEQATTLGDMACLRDELSTLFGNRKLDLVTPSILANPYRRRAIEKDLKVLYVAR